MIDELEPIIDECGDLADAYILETPRGRRVALCDGRYILPGAFTVLSPIAADQIRAGELRALRPRFGRLLD